MDCSGSQLRPLPSIGPTTLRIEPVGLAPSHNTYASDWGRMELSIAESPRSEDRGLRFRWPRAFFELEQQKRYFPPS